MVRIHPDPPPIGDACWPATKGVSRSVGAVAQLGERLLCKQEVIGSIPFSSTSKERSILEIAAFSELAGKLQGLPLIFDQTAAVRSLFNKTEEVKRTRRSNVVCWVRLYRPAPSRVRRDRVSQTPVMRAQQCAALWDQATKCMWWMPWRSQAMKDVAACVKPRGAGKRALIRGCPNGETRPARVTVT
jgi:hypothetical protein